MKPINRIARSLLALPLLLPVGCSPDPYDADVSGVVTLDGEPVGPGVLSFVPADKTQNPSKGNVDDQGRYFLKTKHERGIDSGRYQVAVQAFKPGEIVAPGERANKPSIPAVPEKYLRVTTSGLSYDVEPGRQTIDIALTSQ
ncbi:hypothetical protein [Botrimarina sp.]|uniref:hypothetical protein n=1 Tax=Botrimarina sp. TaxID=2795802 RepID=UPI0032F04A8A